MLMGVLVSKIKEREMSNPDLFSTFSLPMFCGNARIAVIVEILSGLQQLLENLYELFTIPWKTLQVSHITTKSYFISNKYGNLLTCISVYRRTCISAYRSRCKTPYRNTCIST